VTPFMRICQSCIIANAGADASTYLSAPSCANQIIAHELAHAHGQRHADMAGAFLDRGCTTQRLWVEPQTDALIRTAAGIGATEVTGSTFTLAWDAPDSGAPATYLIEAGSAPGLVNIGKFATGDTTTSYRTTVAAPGTYYMRVRAANQDATSSPSNEISVTVVASAGVPPDP